MATPTYTALSTITLGSSASSVTFSSIPASYRDLILVISGSTSGATYQIYTQANTDTTAANYPSVHMDGNGSTTSSAAYSDRAGFYTGAYYTTATNFNAITQIFDYSATDKHKTALSRTNAASAYTIAVATRWASTSAINQLIVKTWSSSLAAGTTLSLYGILG